MRREKQEAWLTLALMVGVIVLVTVTIGVIVGMLAGIFWVLWKGYEITITGWLFPSAPELNYWQFIVCWVFFTYVMKMFYELIHGRNSYGAGEGKRDVRTKEEGGDSGR